ncbi:MAG: hypothetical protein GC146_13390 [Limimaricola sp.]|uniref:F0F1 ATP synthase subunit B family protein n=1 Tax=Limimaricola sp. TaxID=2211665 RepID=UPI001D698B85|nr:hypothetical protein [Limimaricola sp.]MBI1418208.1 hypothetical protein [Limimaricola sp.]
MQFDWVTFAFQLVNVAVLLWLLGRFFFRPVADIVAKRQAETAAALQKAAKAEAAAQAAEVAAKEAAAANAAARMQVLEKARDEAAAQAEAAVKAAQAEARAILQKAQDDLAALHERHDARQVQMAADLAVVLARKVLAQVPPDALLDSFAETLAGKLTALPRDEHAALLDRAEAPRLVVATALTDEAAARLRARLATGWPGAADCPLEVAHGLIAGVEIRSQSGEVRNSLGAGLEKLAEALRDGD